MPVVCHPLPTCCSVLPQSQGAQGRPGLRLHTPVLFEAAQSWRLAKDGNAQDFRCGHMQLLVAMILLFLRQLRNRVTGWQRGATHRISAHMQLLVGTTLRCSRLWLHRVPGWQRMAMPRHWATHFGHTQYQVEVALCFSTLCPRDLLGNSANEDCTNCNRLTWLRKVQSEREPQRVSYRELERVRYRGLERVGYREWGRVR